MWSSTGIEDISSQITFNMDKYALEREERNKFHEV